MNLVSANNRDSNHDHRFAGGFQVRDGWHFRDVSTFVDGHFVGVLEGSEGSEGSFQLLDRGGALRDVQVMAGHKSLNTTQRYIDYDTEAQRRVVSLL